MKTHQLKTDDTWFARIASGEKTAEIRKHDRDFQVGDFLDLIEVYSADGNHFVSEEEGTGWHRKGSPTGRSEMVRITHILPAEFFSDGLKLGYSLLSFAGPIDSQEA